MSTQNTPNILVVDDDARLRELLDQYLSDHGFSVTTAKNAAHAKEYLDFLQFDAMVLDVMMPGQTGVELSEELNQKRNQMPILLLTAMAETENRIRGLETGADDYLTKPFDPKELLLRLKNIIRRAPTPSESMSYQFGEFAFNSEKNTLTKAGKSISLSTAESTLLKVLLQTPGQPISREDLMESCGLDGNERTIDVQITRLRKKVESDPARPKVLQTVRGKGYVFYADIV